MRNQDNILLHAVAALRARLPPKWHAVPQPRSPSTSAAVVKITAPDRRTGALALTARARLDPKDVRRLIDALADHGSRATAVVVAPYLSARTRELLRAENLGHLDLTGNVWIVMPKPGLFIETHGAAEHPNRKERPARTLRGPKAGRVARALIDRKHPLGVRELAALTKLDAGYVSRVLSFLAAEALITRVGHGRLERVDWPALLRRWAQDASLQDRGTVHTFLDPRGLEALRKRLAGFNAPYAVTGSLAAALIAPIAPARLAIVWVRDANAAAASLSLHPTDAGANVMLVEAGDDSVFEGLTDRDGVRYAAASQVALDLLTSPGRGPQEGEALLQWMEANEAAWRI